jgi:hypothetical protein
LRQSPETIPPAEAESEAVDIPVAVEIADRVVGSWTHCAVASESLVSFHGLGKGPTTMRAILAQEG